MISCLTLIRLQLTIDEDPNINSSVAVGAQLSVKIVYQSHAAVGHALVLKIRTLRTSSESDDDPGFK